MGLLFSSTVFASDVDASVVDVTAPTGSVELAPGASAPIVITLTVSGKQEGTATFKVYKDWTLSGGTFTGSNPETFTVGPREAQDPHEFFYAYGTVTVAAEQAPGTFTLEVGAFGITNSNPTGAKLGARYLSSYQVTVLAAPSDDTPPEISYTLTPDEPDGANGWYTSDVTVEWAVVDLESAITSQSGCEDVTVDYDTVGVTFTCTATSGGGEASESVTIKRDAAPPVVTIGGIEEGGEYYFGFVPTPTCAATDVTSGPDGECSVDGYSTTVGDHTITATAKDLAGNETTVEVHYTVLAWTLTGFYQPVDMNGVYNVVKGGSTVPLKFNVFAGPTELTDVAVVKSLVVTQVVCNEGTVQDDIETTATGGTSLRYDFAGGQFIYNWKTPSQKGVCYRVTMTTQDNSPLVAYFKLK